MKDHGKRLVRPGLTRRGFLAFMGGSAGTASLAAADSTGAAEDAVLEGFAWRRIPIRLQVNGKSRAVLVEPRWTLWYVLKEIMGLTGVQAGCGRRECGACTVLIDDRPQYACMVLAVEAEGRTITTLEGAGRGRDS